MNPKKESLWAISKAVDRVWREGLPLELLSLNIPCNVILYTKKPTLYVYKNASKITPIYRHVFSSI
jgi:hypothetical protein